MNASTSDQRTLLDLAELDRRMRVAENARKNPPQAARIQQLTAQKQGQSGELATRIGARDDIQLELSRLESDVTMAKTRRDRDTERLNSAASPKEAVAFEREIASLTKRLSDLEDAELDVMQRLEDADKAVAEQKALIDATNDEGLRLTTEAKDLIAVATKELEQLARDREAVAGGVPADLLAKYTQLSDRGIGAGLLQRGMCGACNMVLNSSDLQDVRKAPENEVMFCPECGAIMVRTEESGL